jgi:hypothetical protein
LASRRLTARERGKYLQKNNKEHRKDEEHGAEERHAEAARSSATRRSYTDEHTSVINFVVISANSPPLPQSLP